MPFVRAAMLHVMTFPEVLKKRGVGMVTAPQVYAFTASDGSAGVRGNEGPSLKADLNPSKPEPSTRIPTVAAGSLDLFD